MGYCASYSGCIELKDDKYSDIVADLSEKILNVGEIDNRINDYIEIFGGSDSRYHDDDWKLFYKEITPYIVSCEVEFIGEDEIYWKHSFENGEWKEYSGKIVYENPFVFVSKDALETEEDKEL